MEDEHNIFYFPEERRRYNDNEVLNTRQYVTRVPPYRFHDPDHTSQQLNNFSQAIRQNPELVQRTYHYKNLRIEQQKAATVSTLTCAILFTIILILVALLIEPPDVSFLQGPILLSRYVLSACGGTEESEYVTNPGLSAAFIVSLVFIYWLINVKMEDNMILIGVKSFSEYYVTALLSYHLNLVIFIGVATTFFLLTPSFGCKLFFLEPLTDFLGRYSLINDLYHGAYFLVSKLTSWLFGVSIQLAVTFGVLFYLIFKFFSTVVWGIVLTLKEEARDPQYLIAFTSYFVAILVHIFINEVNDTDRGLFIQKIHKGEEILIWYSFMMVIQAFFESLYSLQQSPLPPLPPIEEQDDSDSED